jgi:Fe-S-cluster containining protein
MSGATPDVSQEHRVAKSKSKPKVSRRAKRRARAAQFKQSISQPATAMRGFDLRGITLTDLDTIELDSGEHTVTVSVQVPMGDNESFAEYQETLDFDEETTPGYLAAAARQFADAVLRSVKERIYTSGRNPCETCTGACCGRKFTQVRLTQEDVDRLTAAGIDVTEHVEFFEQQSFTGYVGQYKLVPWKGDEDEQACPFLGDDGCGVYEHRPLVCREYSAWDCDLYEEDPEKLDGKTHLRVVKGPTVVK